MTYCIDDLCHSGSPICGAAGPYHCRIGTGPSVDHHCTDDWCEECEHYDYEEDEPGDGWHPAHCPGGPCPCEPEGL